MTDYTPTTAEEMREYCVYPAEFDRWLAAHDAEIKAESDARFNHWTNAAISDKMEAEIRADEREKAALKPERFSEVAESILNAWMEHIGYSAEQVTAALEKGHANCEFIDYGYDCFDDEGISRHPILDEIDGMEQIVVFAMERLAAVRGEGEQA